MAYTELLYRNMYDALRSPAASRIDFWVETIHVDQVAFQTVAFNLMTLQLDISIEKLPGKQTNAIYHRGRDTFLFSRYDYGGTPNQKATMIHESVHAFTDLRNMFWNRYFVDEAAAYLAEALFFLYDTGKTPKQFIAGLRAC